MAQGFDPAAATAAYLAQIPPEAQAKAIAYTQGGHWLLLWGAVISVLVSWLVLRSGVLVKVRDAVRGGKSRVWLVALAVILVDGLVEAVLSFPWTVYSDWWRDKQYGLTSQAFAGWLSEFAVKTGILLVLAVVLFSLLYWVIRRAPKTWWLWAGLATSAVFMVIIVLSPVFIEPLFNKYTPAPPGPVRDAVVRLAEANGVPSDKIYVYNGSKQSNRYTANVSGLFGTARVAMSDVMFQQGADLAEVRGVVGHEMGHYVHMHGIWLALAQGITALVGFFLVAQLFPLALRLTGAKGIEGIADPAGLPVISIILAVIGLLATPITVSFSRIVEADADQFSYEIANEPDGLAKALIKTAPYRAASPSRLEEILFYDHPAVGARVRRAMDWKAAHPRPGD